MHNNHAKFVVTPLGVCFNKSTMPAPLRLSIILKGLRGGEGITTSKLIFLCLVIFSSLLSAQEIRREKLNDGVERWYRVQQQNEQPCFFQQLAEIFNVILPSNDQLPFDKSVAFLVGVSEYDFIRPQLPFVKNDLRDMREMLLSVGGFDEVYIAANQDATAELIENF